MTKNHPVLIIREQDLPIFISIVGSRKKMKVYKAFSDANDGFFLARCTNARKIN